MFGRSAPYGYGVRGVSAVGYGIHGEATDGGIGVQGISDVSVGVRGDSTGGTGVGVWGRSLPTGYGVRGESASGFGVWGSSPQGTAVSGKGRLGGEFAGTRAAVRLVPTGFTGPPATGSHARGELVCDKNGDLWFCKATGVPGTWAQLA